jgi:hypothetical protein
MGGEDDQTTLQGAKTEVAEPGSAKWRCRIKQGYAQLDIVTPNDRYEVTFSQAQDQARQAQRGIWGLPKE